MPLYFGGVLSSFPLSSTIFFPNYICHDLMQCMDIIYSHGLLWSGVLIFVFLMIILIAGHWQHNCPHPEMQWFDTCHAANHPQSAQVLGLGTWLYRVLEGIRVRESKKQNPGIKKSVVSKNIPLQQLCGCKWSSTLVAIKSEVRTSA